MLGRRRVKSKLFPLGSSLYAAVRSIGEALRARYQPPEEVPSDMVRLLTQLNESTEPELQRARCVLEYQPEKFVSEKA